MHRADRMFYDYFTVKQNTIDMLWYVQYWKSEEKYYGQKIIYFRISNRGHPDKICDAVSDAILDALIEKDPMSRVACETAITTGLVLVMGEITTNAYVDIQK